MPNTDPPQDSVSVVEFVRRAGRRGRPLRGAPGGCITIGRRGEQLAPFAELAAAGVHAVHRRRQRRAGPAADAPRARVLARPRHHARPALRGRPAHRGRGDARGRVLQPARPARLAAIAEELMVHRDIELARLTGAPRPPPPPVDGAQRRARARAPRPTACAVTAEATPAPLQPHRRGARRLRPDLQGQPAAARRRPTSPRSGPGWPTARSTRSPPTTRRTRRRPRSSRSTTRRRACSVSRPRSASCLAHLDMPLHDVVAALSWKPAAIAGVADRHGRPIDARGAGQPHRVRSRRRRGRCSRRGLASKSRNTPYVGTAAAGPGAPHDASTATRSSSTEQAQR